MIVAAISQSDSSASIGVVSSVFNDGAEMVEWKKYAKHEYTLLRAMKKHKRHEEVKVLLIVLYH
jgi:hypothetical protein